MRTTALLPATMALFGKKKATLQEVATIWKNSTVQVMENESGKLRFVIGYGHSDYAKTFCAHHDQTGARIGCFREVGLVRISGQGAVQFQSGNVPTSAPILVYK